ncbi:DEAD/DEAH box helicase [Frigidibacter sp. ROC022]|uniref:DEAD/DEAH box helicase n=1 Tax=Frigidibacter sp. ROC022 TaxID=2971796 RepID=UPI00215A9F50|nr:DEAD/DEAH box helicase [Frigidibacter sp. ROC022]MCR8726073.1 DEAD/DEAH box helicase [Frigidibacter sp. ROC022]
MIKTLQDALTERGYDKLTDVQEAVTAAELQDADLLVSAQTGSGKTVGFGLAIARTLMGDDEQLGPAAAPLALIVAPTRELAFQVMRELAWLYAKAEARVVSCVGGMDMRDERRALDRGAHIVVGTPGRLRDHIQRGSLEMNALRAVVLDEADEMLDLGFREDLEFMLAAAPVERRTLMFSATVPPTIAKLAKQFQRDAVRVSTTSGASQHADISYQALQVAERDAEHAIFNLLRYHDATNAIVFANTRVAVSHLTARLANRNFSVVSLSGELSQAERTHALQAMRDGRARVCVATDVAARGIDLPNLELVIHADLPSNPEGLLHRSGRTGRAGRKGISALIVTPKNARKAERLLGFAKITAEWTAPPGVEDILRRDKERLLADPVWDEEVTEDQAAFAADLLALHAPEKIAAAYLRLYQARQSAPEELSPPGAKPAPRERKPFGPSIWFAVSAGREQNAEARWLLPLLCRAGGITKDEIGAIRIQHSESFVELKADSVEGFLGNLPDGVTLQDGVTIRQMEGVPELGVTGRGRKPHKARDRAPRERPADRGPSRRPAPADDRPPAPVAAQADPAAEAPQPAPAPTAPVAEPAPAVEPAPAPEPKPAKPRKPRHGDGGAPAGPRAKSPGPKPSGKPRFDRPKSRPAGSGPRKAASEGSSAAPKGPRPGAADPSKRFERPGKAGPGKPRSKAPRKPRPHGGGGAEPPRRKKRS